MKALTICQPYAELIASGEKRVENRTWTTRYRGPLAIHAGKSREWLTGDWGPARAAELPFGAVVATATLLDCLHIDLIRMGKFDAEFPWLREHEHVEGPWCWVLGGVRRFPIPIPGQGKQGLWEWTP